MSSKIKEGDLFSLNGGGTAQVLKYHNCHKVTVQFIDKYMHITDVYADNLRRGSVKNPYQPSVLGKGFIGVGPFKTKANGKQTHTYHTWKGVLNRVFCAEFHKKQPTYVGCGIDESWLNFQTFAKWCEAQTRKEGWVLDKDLLSGKVKTYSPETCRFIPRELNNLLTLRETDRGDLPLGVSRSSSDPDRYVATLSVDGHIEYLGVFSSPLEAFSIYRTAKLTNIRRLADLFKSEIDPLVYEALISYRIRPFK